MLRYSMFHSLATSLLPYIHPIISSKSIRWCTYKLNSQGFIIVLDGAFSVSYNVFYYTFGLWSGSLYGGVPLQVWYLRHIQCSANQCLLQIHSSYLTVIVVREMHGQMHHNHCQITNLLAHDPPSTL